jgi:hypothetical protein
MSRRRVRFAALLALAFTGVGAALYAVFPYFLPDDFSPVALELTSKRGDPIIAALEVYKSQAGNYPQTLQDAHIDLDAFEPPIAGVQKWSYRYGMVERGEYYLYVRSRVMPGPWGGIVSYSYSSARKKWELVRSQPL